MATPAEPDRGAATSGGGGSSLPQRIGGALLLRREAFREVAGDPAATLQAGLVVALGGAAQQVGLSAIGLVDGGSAPGALASAVAGALVAWLVPAVILWAVALRLAPGPVALAPLLRSIGFAAAPQLLYLGCPLSGAGAGPGEALAWAVAATAWILAQAALFVAVRETLRIGVLQALALFALAGVATVVLGLALAAVLPAALWQPLVL
jgi:hypothetical protein